VPPRPRLERARRGSPVDSSPRSVRYLREAGGHRLPRIDNTRRAAGSASGETWPETYERLSGLDPATMPPQELEALADAAWLACRLDESYLARQKAYASFLERHEDRPAARTAWRLFWEQLYNGSEAVALGWLRRARRHLAPIAEGPEHGYVALAESELALGRGSLEEAEARAMDAVAIGERHETPAIVAFGLTLHGRALVAQSRLEEGCASMDEAMTFALNERLDAFFTGAVYCTVIAECRAVADMRRASEWTDAAEAWCASLPGITPYHGICRVHRGWVLGLRGDLEEAESEIRAAGEELTAFKPRSAADAFAALGEIRRRRGDLAGAEESFLRSHQLGGDPQPGLALIRLAQGQTAVAAAALYAALSGASANPLTRAHLLAAQVDSALAARDRTLAQDAARELSRIAETLSRPSMAALAEQARGAVSLAVGDAGGAIDDLRAAREKWSALGLPYEEAQARLLVGAATRALGDEEGARLEIQTSRATFERLGARRDALHAAALLARSSDRPAGLTPREIEVLRLVAGGKSNRQIAQMLVISEYTVARHVQNILAKLGVSSRSAAAAFAVEHHLA
jgi:DNA-binding CsgD family transcriptional regulator